MELLPVQNSNAQKISDFEALDTRDALIAAAREIFVANGFAHASTPEIVRKASLTRGALYHYFENKTDLFRAVVTQEAKIVARDVSFASPASDTPQKAMMEGARAYFEAMKVAGRSKLLLIEGPSVLGADEMSRIDAATGAPALREGLANIARAEGINLPLDALSELLAAMFDRAAFAISNGTFAAPYETAVKLVLRSIATR